MADNSQCSNQTSIPDASQPLIYFFILTGIYAIVRYMTTKVNPTDPNINFQDTSLVWTIIYILLLIIGNYFINLNITTSICGNTQWTNTLIITLVPWILIFTVINLLLLILPGWLSPFSNTIGYGVAKILGLDKLMNNILKPKAIIDSGAKEGEIDRGQEIISENLQEIYSDRSLLINEIPQGEGFMDFWNNLLNSRLIRNQLQSSKNVPQLTIYRNTLYNFVILKNVIAQLIWFILTGCLVTSVAYNYIVNSSCTRSVAQMSATHKAYTELQNKLNNENVPKTTYTLSTG